MNRTTEGACRSARLKSFRQARGISSYVLARIPSNVLSLKLIARESGKTLTRKAETGKRAKTDIKRNSKSYFNNILRLFLESLICHTSHTLRLECRCFGIRKWKWFRRQKVGARLANVQCVCSRLTYESECSSAAPIVWESKKKNKIIFKT